MSQSFPTVSILGAGSMGQAIMHGLMAAEGAPQKIQVTRRSAAAASALNEERGVTAYSTAEQPEANRRAVTGAGLVIIAVKPDQVIAVLEEVVEHLEPDAVVVSVAAGITTAAMRAVLPPTMSVLRAMPNTPALIGKAVTGLAAADGVDDEALALGRAVFAAIGTVVEVPEEQLDALTAISGSGPAYVFYLVEQLMTAAQARGFSAAQSRELVYGTFSGAVALLLDSDKSPRQLRDQVTSPAGTTAAAVDVFEDAGLGGILDRATAAAAARAEELSQQ